MYGRNICWSVRLHSTVYALCRHGQLVTDLTNLHNQLMDALVHKKESLPDSASIQLQFKEKQVQIKYCYIDHAKLNTEINEAIEVLKTDMSKLQYLNKWAFRKLVIGCLTSCCMVWYMTGSWLNWQWFILGAITVAVAGIAFGLMLRLLKVRDSLLFITNIFKVSMQQYNL